MENPPNDPGSPRPPDPDLDDLTPTLILVLMRILPIRMEPQINLEKMKIDYQFIEPTMAREATLI